MTIDVDIDKKMNNFNELLSTIENLNDKKKHLWVEIYQNAIIDRQNAYQNYMTLVVICDKKSSEHAVHGKTIATFLERMNKANDQLIRLAELIEKAQQNSASPKELSKDDMYNLIKGGN